jgi:hypothetical protein
MRRLFVNRATTLVILIAVIELSGCDSGRQDGPAPAPSGSIAPSSASPDIVPLAYHYLGIVRSHRIGNLTLGQAAGCADVPGGVCVQSVSADGEPRSLDSLEGKIVEVDATVLPTLNTATVAIRRAVVGPVDAVDLARARLTVMGQDVYLYGVGGEGSLPQLAVGDVVEVNGYVGRGGQVFATRIDLVDPKLQDEPVFLVRGILSMASDGRLEAGGLVLDLSGASVEGFPASSPIAGDAVVLFGSRRPVAGTFMVGRAVFDGKVWPL